MLSIDIGFSIQLFCLSKDEISDMMKNSPDWWGINDGGRHDLMIAQSEEEAKEAFTDFERFVGPENSLERYKQFIFMSTTPEYRNKTKLLRISTTVAFNRATIRNSNTMHKLTELMRK